MPRTLPFAVLGSLSQASTSILIHPLTIFLFELVLDEILGNSAWNLPYSQCQANLSHEESQWSWRSRKAAQFLTMIERVRFLRPIRRRYIQSTKNRHLHRSFWNRVKVLVTGTKGFRFLWTLFQSDNCRSFRVQNRQFSLNLPWKWGYCGVLNLCARIHVDEDS